MDAWRSLGIGISPGVWIGMREGWGGGGGGGLGRGDGEEGGRLPVWSFW